MIQNIYSVFDSKASAYLPPFYLPTEGMAVRVFSDCVNSDDHQFGRHPADFTLFYLGTWDDGNAIFECEKRALFNGLEVLDNGRYDGEEDKQNGKERTPSLGDET